jgi:ubiquinone/menaquinone biosynthesis C-methylase UbiE
MKLAKNKYQLNFSDNHKILYDENERKQKANKILAVLKDHLGQLNNLKLLDIGSSTGIITSFLSKNFLETVGIDIDEKAVQYAKENFENEHLHFYIQDAINISFPDSSFDIVNCTHIYEHVPDSKRLMDEIYRVLRPAGVCFFAAGNRIQFFVEDYNLPLLSVIPKWLAHKYIRLFKKADFYYENSLSYWGLKQLTSRFEIIDYTKKVIKNPVKYYATDMVNENSITQWCYLFVLKIAYWICPTYIWILKKS